MTSLRHLEEWFACRPSKKLKISCYLLLDRPLLLTEHLWTERIRSLSTRSHLWCWRERWRPNQTLGKLDEVPCESSCCQILWRRYYFSTLGLLAILYRRAKHDKLFHEVRGTWCRWEVFLLRWCQETDKKHSKSTWEQVYIRDYFLKKDYLFKTTSQSPTFSLR